MVKIGNVPLDNGMPKICVPGRTRPGMPLSKG